MTFFEILPCAFLAVFVYMNLLFVTALLRKRNDIVDIAWGPGFLIVGAVSLISASSLHWRLLLSYALVGLWALRLALHIWLRNKAKTEDFRYAQWRKDWGKTWVLRSWLQIFMLQGFFMLTVSYPLILQAGSHKDQLLATDLLGLLIWAMGFFFETVGDEQLRRFKQNPANKGKIMDRGLWSLTRHPNYFGEASMWWGVFVISLGASHGIWAIFSPLIITWLLVKVSGVPMLEKRYQTDPVYREYVKRVSGFVPWKKKA